MSIIQGTSKSSAAAAYTIDQSIRFNDNDSAYLEKTFASAGNRQIWTWSAWIKLSGSTARQIIFGATTGPSYISINENATGSAFFNLYNAGWYWETAAKYRDPSAWYHLVWAFDTTNATADNRMRFYVNGLEVTDYSTKHTTGSQNASGGINNNVVHRIGRHPASSNYFDGYLAEINFVDGQQLTPTDFGKTNAGTGQWVPIDASGLTFGTRGFYLKGEDSSDLGNDSSGNNNDFTSSGLAAADQVTDSPTDNFCVLNPIDPATTGTLSDGNLVTSGNAKVTMRPSSGQWYYEKDGVGVSYDADTSGQFDPTLTAGTYNFGQSAWSDTGPTGSEKVLSTANLTDTTITTSGSFTGNASAGGPFIYLNGVPTAMTINGNSVTFATHADKLANGFKVRTSSSSYNASGSNSSTPSTAVSCAPLPQPAKTAVTSTKGK